ncbi:MAG TPA: PTS sugar transporter subunit IIA [Nitrospinaceae bacterium]|jgi:PTS system nitrogen regulatory IIA component|nr:PTS sugar transporter subunit IIA [Nitrospinaceae bacterium]HIB43128.1 PTS sugar transporter subunit IIA [Nitrospina sp.]HIN87874.1 PTS sugar transporter subunit IIA [Nitrospinaceae bacterium]
MKISDILKKEHVIKELNSCDKKNVLDELSSFLEDEGEIANKESLLAALIEREKLGSTGIGENVAIPHAKISEIDKIITVFGRSKNGVEFESLDQKPVNFIFLVIAPENSTSQHLKALARISRLFKNASLRESVLRTNEADQIYSILVDEDSKFI